jgi:hypothetical protein
MTHRITMHNLECLLPHCRILIAILSVVIVSVTVMSVVAPSKFSHFVIYFLNRESLLKGKAQYG